jgi:signal transduction histidine kinase
MPEIEINSNNLSRALYNLIDNSFYAVQEKYRLISENKLITGEKISTLGSDNSIKAFKTKLLGGTNGYSPQIKITTRMVDRGVEICIADNGLGIDKNILDKIFNPFFTTKPLGEGTGLGLSISYEIIKAHNGELHVETRAGDFSEFKIKLPAKHIHDPV